MRKGGQKSINTIVALGPLNLEERRGGVRGRGRCWAKYSQTRSVGRDHLTPRGGNKLKGGKKKTSQAAGVSVETLRQTSMNLQWCLRESWGGGQRVDRNQSKEQGGRGSKQAKG